MQRFHAKTLKQILAAAILIMGMAPAQAKKPAAPTRPAAETAEAAIDRFGISAHAGVNVVSPFFGVQLSYRLPIDEERIRLVAQYDFYNSGWYPDTDPQYLMLGLRYDFLNPRAQVFWPYFQALAGLMLLKPAPSTYGNTLNFAAEAAIGAETHIIGPLWGFAQIGAFFPILVRTELGLRLAF